MRKDRKIFILIELCLAAMLMITIGMAILENVNHRVTRVSVILQNSESKKWSALKYGLKMAAQDTNVEVYIVNTEKYLSVEEQEGLIENEMAAGADAVLIQATADEEEALMLDRMMRRVQITLIESERNTDNTKLQIDTVEPNHVEMGKALVDVLMKNYEGNLRGKKIGILASTDKLFAIAARKEAFMEALSHTGAEIVWNVTASALDDDSVKNVKQSADIVVAVDDDSLIHAAELSKAGSLSGAVVYGIGQSMSAIYYLDTKVVEAVIVPDEFNVGYKGVISALNKGKQQLDTEIGYTVVDREDLFTKKYSDILFTMSQ